MRAGFEGISRLRMIRIRACYRLIYNHPLLFSILLFLIYLRISFPYIFYLLISASPVVISTAILLCALLALGQKQAQAKGHKFSSSRLNCNSQFNFKDKFAEVRKDIVEKEIKEPKHNVDHLMLVYNDKFPKTEFKKQLKEITEKGDDMDHSSSSSSYENESDVAPMPTLCDYHSLKDLEDHHHDQILDDGQSHKGNDRAPRLKKAKKENDVSSMIQEDHEELIKERSHDYEIDVHDDDGDGDEEDLDHTDLEEDEDEDEEDHELKLEGIETMVSWTEEDEKNLKEMSRLELERNRQLERIMSRRIAQRTYSTITEKSLMDLDMSDLPFSVTSISTAKTNPFDVSYLTSHQPETAPALFPRRNPFDDLSDCHETKANLHTDHQQSKSDHGKSKHQSFNKRHHEDREGGVPHQYSADVSNREALFRRYQSFGVVGSSFYGFLWQENEEESSNPFKPYLSDHQDNIHGSDSLSVTSSSSSAGVEEQEEDSSANSSQSSTKSKGKEKGASMSSETGEEPKNSNVEHIEPVYDTSPSSVAKNVLLSSESSEVQEGKSEM